MINRRCLVLYDPRFDHDGDGKLSDSEMMDKAYFESEMFTENSSSDGNGGIRKPVSGYNSKSGIKLLGGLLLIIGLESFIYFPVFAIIMIGIAVMCFVR